MRDIAVDELRKWRSDGPMELVQPNGSQWKVSTLTAVSHQAHTLWTYDLATTQSPLSDISSEERLKEAAQLLNQKRFKNAPLNNVSKLI